MSRIVAHGNPQEDSRLKRLLLPTQPFLRSAKRITKRNPAVTEELRLAVELLAACK